MVRDVYGKAFYRLRYRCSDEDLSDADAPDSQGRNNSRGHGGREQDCHGSPLCYGRCLDRVQRYKQRIEKKKATRQKYLAAFI